MRRRSQALPTLQKLVTECGIPHTIHSDNAPEFKSDNWNKFLRKYLISSSFTEPHHPNQNTCERRGGVLKAATVHLLTVTAAPLIYWCYALEYVCLLQSVLAHRNLDWNCPHTLHYGDTPDISVFRFVFWCPVWFYAPSRSFPRSRMLPGRFLGIACNAGDAFCFLVLTNEDDPSARSVIARSVVRRRYPREQAPVVEESSRSSLRFYKSDGRTPLEDPPIDGSLPLPDFVHEAKPVPSFPHELDPSEGSMGHDPLRDAIAEVYGPPSKRQRIEFIDPLSAARHTDVDPVLSRPPRSADMSMESAPKDVPPAVAIVPTPEDVDDGPRSSATPSTGVSPSDLDLQDHIESDVFEDATQHFESLSGDEDPNDLFDKIVGHSWDNGILLLELAWTTGESSSLPFTIVKRDYPLPTAHYILTVGVGTADGRYSSGRYTRWARGLIRQVNRTVRRLRRMASGDILRLPDGRRFQVDDSLGTARLLRRTTVDPHVNQRPWRKKKKKNPGRISRGQPVFKYGVEVPKDTAHAQALDEANGNALWKEAADKEIASLLTLGCFDFRSPDDDPGKEFQYVKLTMIYEVKQDGRRKARLVAGGHLVDPRGVNTRSTVVKGVSVRLLDLIAHRDKLKIVCGDVGNAFVTAPCLEKVYSRAGPEFGEQQDAVMILVKALYGLRSSSRAFRGHFADFLKSLGFRSCRYDHDVWMRLRDDHSGYDYLCTHVDDFKIVAADPDRWIEHIKAVFHLKSVGPPSYYLGNDYTWSPSEEAWVLGCSTYIKERIRRLEDNDMLDGKLYEHKNPLPAEVHPEMDTSPLLDVDGTRLFQTLIGMAQWACTIGRLDISFATSSLSRFSAAPREGHLKLAVYMFGYLKKNPNRSLVINSQDPIIPEEWSQQTFHPDFLEDYPDAREDIDKTLTCRNPTGRSWRPLFSSILTTPMTRRRAALSAALSNWLDAPQSSGPVRDRVVLQPLPTAPSSSRCVRLWRRQYLYDICSVVWVSRLVSLPICLETIMDPSKVLASRIPN